MEIKGEVYRVVCDDATDTVVFEGILRLRGTEEYAPIRSLLAEIAGSGAETITLDVRELQFLNSAGINMLIQSVLAWRERAVDQIVVLGSADIPWQRRSLPNMEKLVPQLQLVMGAA